MSNVKDYKVDETTVEEFQGLSTFAKNMVLKDSMIYENEETDGSRFFGNLLLKYYNTELTYKDIKELLNFVYGYNDYINGKINEKDSDFKRKAYGISKDQDYENSLVNIIVESIISDNLELSSYKDYIKTIVTNGYFKDYYNKESCNFKIIDSEGLANSNLKYNINEEDNIFILTLTEKDKEKNFNINSNEITKLKAVFESKEKILFNIASYDEQKSETEKLKASEVEKNLTNNGDIIVFFDLRFRRNSILDENGDIPSLLKRDTETVTFERQLLAAQDISSDKDVDNCLYSVQILYKEFNPIYRNVLNSTNIDVLLNYYNEKPNKEDTNEKDEISNFNSICDSFNKTLATNTYINSYVTKFIKNLDTGTTFLNRDFYSYNEQEKKVLTKTLKLFKYQYGNPYIARNATESEIMVYYYGDNYISYYDESQSVNNLVYSGYGSYKYQREEIYSFLKNFQFVHDYYYKVLLNESFTKENEYKLYEKIFITFWALEKTLSEKLDNIHDIDHFNLTDIQNFFESYGLGSLAKIIKNNYDINLEQYSLNLIKSYIKLVQNKGSKAITEIIQEAFSIDKKSMKVYRLFLYKDVDETYKFSRIEGDSSDNILREVIKNKTSEKTMEDMLKDNADPYWDVENDTTKEILDKVNLNGVNTKYIIPEITNEIAQSYNEFRIALAGIEYIFNKIGNDKIITTISNIDIENKDSIFLNSATIKEHIDVIRWLFMKYVDLSIEKESGIKNLFGVKQPTYHINSEKINNYNKYFTHKIKDAKEVKSEIIGEKLNKFKKYYETTGKRNEYKLIELYLQKISFLNAFNQMGFKDKNEKITEKLNLNGSEISSLSFPVILTSILQMPKYYFSDNNFLFTDIDNSDKIAYEYDARNFVKTMFESIFLSTNKDNSNIMYTSENFEISDKLKIEYRNPDLLTCKNAISISLSLLNNTLNQALELNLYSNIQTIIKFLKDAIEYFISYTTQIFQLEYNNSYNTRAEEVDIRDKFELNEVNMSESDSFFYDESLTINEVKGV